MRTHTELVRQSFAALSIPRFWLAIAVLAVIDLGVSWFAVRQGDVVSGRSLTFDLWDNLKLAVATAGGVYLYRNTKAMLSALLALLPLAFLIDHLFSLHIQAGIMLQRQVDFSLLSEIVPMSTPNLGKIVVLVIGSITGAAVIWSVRSTSHSATHARILITIVLGFLVVVGPAFEVLDALTGATLDLGFTQLDSSLMEETVERALESLIVAILWVFGWRAAITNRGVLRN